METIITTRRRFITGKSEEDQDLEIIFDAYFSEGHTRESVITDEPVETGVSLTDHQYSKPNLLTIEVGVTDTPLLTDKQGTPSNQLATTFSGLGRRTVTAFQVLENLRLLGIVFDVQTGLELYANMMIQSIRVDQDLSEGDNALVATVVMKQVTFASTESVSYAPRAPKKAKKKKQTVEKKSEEASVKEEPKIRSTLESWRRKLKGSN